MHLIAARCGWALDLRRMQRGGPEGGVAVAVGRVVPETWETWPATRATPMVNSVTPTMMAREVRRQFMLVQLVNYPVERHDGKEQGQVGIGEPEHAVRPALRLAHQETEGEVEHGPTQNKRGHQVEIAHGPGCEE